MTEDELKNVAALQAVHERNVRELKERLAAFRRAVLELCQDKRVLEDIITRQNMYILELRRRYGVAPHDFEPARPGIEDVD